MECFLLLCGIGKINSLYLVSDRLGKKPLYWSNIDGNIIFGSELKSLMSFCIFKKEINKNSLQNFLQFSYINAPNTIFKNTYKIEPASIIRFNKNKEIKKTLHIGILLLISINITN